MIVGVNIIVVFLSDRLDFLVKLSEIRMVFMLLMFACKLKNQFVQTTCLWKALILGLIPALGK